MLAEGSVKELVLVDGQTAALILCPPRMIPAPGQYLHAYDGGTDALHSSALAASVYPTKIFADGFIAAPPVPSTWFPGTQLQLRGPLGHGFSMPNFARRVALIAWDDSFAPLKPLMDIAIKQGSEVVAACKLPPEDLPLQVEVQLLSALAEVFAWAGYVAMDLKRESLNELREKIGMSGPLKIPAEAQVLVRTAMPCGGLAECGVCSVNHRLACADGPVFDLKELL